MRPNLHGKTAGVLMLSVSAWASASRLADEGSLE
jgi:hypothetical protein